MAQLRKFSMIYKIAAMVLVFIILVAIFAPLLAPYDPNSVNTGNRLEGLSKEHVFGTDALGRDVLSRIIYGARVSVSFALVATVCTMIVGVLLGTLGGYFGGRLDRGIQVLVNIFQGLPGMSMMIAIAGTMGPSTGSLLLAITLTSWAGFSRIVRGEILKVREESYIEGTRSMGASHFYIIVHDVLPNIFGPFIVLFTVRIGTVVLSVASLSFLGLGIQPPQADWGVMVNDAKTYFRSYPNLLLAPGLCILSLCASINLVGDAMRDYFSIKDSFNKQYL